jgi:transcriptional regulator of nitric oxide reductase
MEQILIPMSPGELLDKITILEIKSERMADEAKLRNVRLELSLLNETWTASVVADDSVKRIHADLKRINEALWEIEDDIRDKEKAREFDEKFIELARAVYVTNDQRANAKKELNTYLGSDIVEEKSYQDYS